MTNAVIYLKRWGASSGANLGLGQSLSSWLHSGTEKNMLGDLSYGRHSRLLRRNVLACRTRKLRRHDTRSSIGMNVQR